MTDLPALIREHGLDSSGPVLDLARAAYEAGVADGRKPRPAHRPAYGQTDAERAVLRRIWDLHIDGRSFAAIARELNSDSVQTPAGKAEWSRGSVASLVRRMAQTET